MIEKNISAVNKFWHDNTLNSILNDKWMLAMVVLVPGYHFFVYQCNSRVMSLTEIIIKKIRDEGPIPFRDFMEMALYYPGLGYYTSDKDNIGMQEGDYYTSPVISSIFGEMIGKQFEEMWHLLDKKKFTVVEYGAGSGTLCYHILSYLRKNEELYKELEYCIIEKRAFMHHKQDVILDEKVKQYNSIHDIPEISGCILSNELIDNFSVHQVAMEDQLMEVFIDYTHEFVEVLKPASEAIKDYMDELQATLPRGFRTEVNLQAIEWISEIARSLKKGFVLTIDYGFLSAELYSEKRSLGTLLCYHKHKVNSNPYINIGEQDITSHVNFSALHRWGIKYGLESCGFSNQAHFLHALGLVNHLRIMEKNGKNSDGPNTKEITRIYTLLMDMGSKFKVLIQQKGMQQPRLSGMQFSKNIF